MNAEAESRYRERKDESAELGQDAFRRQALRNLKLKTVIKALAFNQTNASCHNLFATVGKDQATVYDDCHLGDFVSVVVQWTNVKTEYSPGGELQACAWLNTDGLTTHPHGDACLAAAGTDATISIISIVEGRVIQLLKGHTSTVVDLAAAAQKPGLLASLSKDGNLRVWDVEHERCLASHASDATCLAVDPEGTCVVAGGKRGALRLWHTPLASPAARSTPNGQALKIPKGTHNDTIECVRFLPGQRLVVRSCDGAMSVRHFPSLLGLAGWKVPSSGLGVYCPFSSTPDGAFICAGNAQGHVYVYDTASGDRIAHIPPVKVTAPVRACALSPDCRHLLVALGPGFIFRHEFVRPAQAPPAALDAQGSGEAPAQDGMDAS